LQAPPGNFRGARPALKMRRLRKHKKCEIGRLKNRTRRDLLPAGDMKSSGLICGKEMTRTAECIEFCADETSDKIHGIFRRIKNGSSKEND